MSITEQTNIEKVIDELSGDVKGAVVCPGDIAYDEARVLWNGRIERHPYAIVQAKDVEDVRRVVTVAGAHNMRLAICGAGHHPSGFGSCDEGIVLSMASFKELSIDQAGVVRAGSGVLMGEFAEFLLHNDRILTIGSHGSVGLAGLTLGGGMGLLMGRYGLLSDNLIGAEVVTADGVLRTASENENPDLLWALKGGGGNFGVVISLTFQSHPLEPIIAGSVIHPVPRTAEVLRFYREYTQNLPDALTVYTIVQTGPNGMPVCMMVPCYSGNVETGERLLQPLKEFGPPVANFVHQGPYSKLLEATKHKDPYGDHYAMHACPLTELSDGVIDAVAESAATLTSSGSTIIVYHQHGVASRLPNDSSAYAARHVEYFLGAFAGWQGSEPDAHLEWLEAFKEKVAPWTGDANCASLHTVDEESLEAAYGHNYRRLQEIKAKWDPKNFFHVNHNIPPLAFD